MSKIIEYIRGLRDKYYSELDMKPSNGTETRFLNILRNELDQSQISFIYDYTQDSFPVRIVLKKIEKVDKHGNSGYNAFPECNGIVFEYPSLRILAVPPLLHVTKTEFNCDEYDVIPMKDGTTVTLYSYDGAWQLSSSKGMNVWETKLNCKTYREAIEEALSRYEFSYEKLDRNRSYTIGFHHPDYHVFTLTETNEPQAWFIHACDIEKYNEIIAKKDTTVFDAYDNCIDVECDIGLPTQKLEANLDLITLYAKNRLAIYDMVTNKTVNYGFILRTKKYATTKTESIVYLKSVLYDNISRLLYAYRITLMSNSIRGENIDRYKYISLYWFLSPKYYKLFIQLFPQYRSNYVKYFKIVNDIAEKISKNIADLHNPINEYERYFKQTLIPSRKLIEKNKYTGEIIRDLLINLSSFSELYQYIFQSSFIVFDNVNVLKKDENALDNFFKM